MAPSDVPVAVIGGGVVGCAVAHALARRGVEVVLLEAERELALGASGANSGILHTGFDSVPGELETRLILRSAELREELLAQLGPPLLRCGARLEPAGPEETATVARLADNSARNGVLTRLAADGSLSVPGEAITDPVAFVGALAGAAAAGGAELRLGSPVMGICDRAGGVALELAGGELIAASAAVNCAGLFADEVARMAGDELVSVYPRKGEFLVFKQPAGPALEQILLPVPSAMGKGVLVFPTLDGHVLAGPTAREREDKRDWSVESDAAELIMARALRMYPALELAEQVGAYAGLRPAGRGANYRIAHSRAIPRVVHVAAIRSTGLSACLGIGEYVARMLAVAGLVELGPPRVLTPATQPSSTGRWWEHAARVRAQSAARATQP